MAKKSKLPLTAEEQLELELQLETDLGRFQRQYQIMDQDRKAFTGGASSKLAKQQRVIRILKKEEQNITTDLHIATSDAKRKQDSELSANLMDLLAEFDDFDDQITTEKTHLQEIDYQIRKIEKQVIDLRAKQLTDMQYQARIAKGRKTVEGLENKLDTTVKQFCTILTENQKLRAQIDHLLKERTDFNKLWERLIGNLNHGKKFMLDLIEQATIAYDQREEWCSRLQALRTRAHSDLILHIQEMRELQGRIDHEGKLQEFLNVKCQIRVMKALEDKKIRKRQIERENMEILLEKYKNMLDNIKEFTGESDIDMLAKHFVKQEEENFALFNYINKLNAELEDLSDKIAVLEIKIDEQRALNETRELQQATTLTNLENDLTQITQEADDAEEALVSTENQLQNMFKGIGKLFQICKCSNAPFLELLGDNTTINYYNVLLYLNTLERQVSELIVNVYYKEKSTRGKGKAKGDTVIKEEKVKHRLYLVEQFCPSQPCPLCVEQEQVSDVIDTLQFALTKEEVAVKLYQRLQLPDGLERVHNVSACHLPKSRQIIQKRYQ